MDGNIDDDIVEETPLNRVNLDGANDDDDIEDDSQDLLALPSVGPSILPTSNSSPVRRKRDTASATDATPTKKNRHNAEAATLAPTMVTSPTSVTEDPATLPAIKFRVPPFATSFDIEKYVVPRISDKNLISHVIFSRASNQSTVHPYFVVLTSKDPTVISFLVEVLAHEDLYNVPSNPITMTDDDWGLIDEVQVSNHLQLLSSDTLVQYVKSKCTVPQHRLVAEQLQHVNDGASLMDWFLHDLPSIGKDKNV